jgi:hypothetical protein
LGAEKRDHLISTVSKSVSVNFVVIRSVAGGNIRFWRDRDGDHGFHHRRSNQIMVIAVLLMIGVIGSPFDRIALA